MKHFLFSLLAMISVTISNAQSKPESTSFIIAQACKEARLQNKKVFIIFHASWCIWCHKLDSSMNDVSCKNFFDSNYVIKHIIAFETDDKEKLNTPGAIEFLTAHHAADQGIPAWFIFDAGGNLLADSQLRPKGSGFDVEGSNIGCPANDTEIKYFISILEKTAHVSNQQKQAIAARFARNRED